MSGGSEKPGLSIRTTLLLIISVLNVLIAILLGSDVYSSWVRLEEARRLKEDSVTIGLLYQSMKYFSQERGASFSVLYASPAISKGLHEDMLSNRKAADASLDKAFARISSAHFPAIETIQEKMRILQGLRRELDVDLKNDTREKNSDIPNRMFEADTEMISAVQHLIISITRSFNRIDVRAGQHLRFKYFVWELTEYAGREYAMIGRLIVENKPLTPELQEKLLLWQGRIQHSWELTRQLAVGSGLEKSLSSHIDEAETHYFMTFDQIKDFFYTPGIMSADNPYPITIEVWLTLASEAVESLLTLKDRALQETQNYVDGMETQARQMIIVNLLLFTCAVLLSLYCLRIIVRRVIRPVNLMVDTLYKATRGEPYQPPAIPFHQDEIGKLARVLEVFQENVRKIEQSNVELERFAYISAHDLKSPLRAINALSQWIEEELGDGLHGKSREYMDTLRARVRRMEKLLDDTLEYSRAGIRSDSKTEIVNGLALIKDIVALASPPKNFTVKIDERFRNFSLPRLPVQQVLYNLINNAIKHHDRENGTVEITVEEQGDHYIFTIRDDGPGIEPQYHQKIFEMYQTLKSRDEKEGSGMGLALVKKILAAYKGDIMVESEVGQGASFRVKWPKFSGETKT
jgi:signal transduction histidine kinase